MAQPPRIRYLTPSSITKSAGLDSILQDLNSFIRDVDTALAANLTPSENLAQCWVEARVTQGQDVPLIPFSLGTRSAYGVTVERAEVVSGALTGAVFVDWEQTSVRGSPALRLRNVYGLGTGAVVNLRLLVKAQ